MNHDRHGVGIGLMVAAVTCFAAMDTVVRAIVVIVPVVLILWARYAFQMLATAIWLAVKAPRRLLTSRPLVQVLRGLLLLGASAVTVVGLRYLPVAEYTAIFMLSPLIVTLLSVWLLRDAVTPLNWVLIAGGFVGALIVIRPGSGVIGWAALLPIAGATIYAGFQILTRQMAHQENVATMHFYTGLIGTAVTTPLLFFGELRAVNVFDTLPLRDLGALVLVGALGTTGHLGLIFAFRMARPSVLMPFVYAQIAAAGILGWLVFGHVPDRWSIVGMAVIAACGVVMVWLRSGGRAAQAVRSARAD